MKPKLLVIVSTDPRKSPRPAEAIRIAAGVGTWRKADVTLYLRGAAVLALSEFADELEDGDNFIRYLPIVGEFGRPVYVQKGVAELQELGETRLSWQELDDKELACMAADHNCVSYF